MMPGLHEDSLLEGVINYMWRQQPIVNGTLSLGPVELMTCYPEFSRLRIRPTGSTSLSSRCASTYDPACSRVDPAAGITGQGERHHHRPRPHRQQDRHPQLHPMLAGD